MASKRASLFGRSTETPIGSNLVTVPEAAAATTAGLKQDRPPSRQGKKIVSMFVSPEASKQLKMIAIRNDTTVQALMVEALNDLFAKHSVNRIAE